MRKAAMTGRPRYLPIYLVKALGGTVVWFCIDIETFFMIAITFGFYFFEGSIVKMFARTPKLRLANTTF